jgi:hypothetical protein
VRVEDPSRTSVHLRRLERQVVQSPAELVDDVPAFGRPLRPVAGPAVPRVSPDLPRCRGVRVQSQAAVRPPRIDVVGLEVCLETAPATVPALRNCAAGQIAAT